MCGIVGYITTGQNIHETLRSRFLKNALILDELRGRDSTGVFSVYDNFKVHHIKSAVPGHTFVDLKMYQDGKTDGWASIGHNRAATAGSVNKNNAHPFKFGDVTLVHNGTLHNGGKAIKTYNEEFDVDSMQIAYALSQVPPGEAKEVMSQIDGSFTLVWADERDQSINMARNDRRPLHFSQNKHKNILMFMSDGQMLYNLLKYLTRTEDPGVYSMGAGHIYKFQKGSIEPREVIKFNPFVWRSTYLPIHKRGGENKSWKPPNMSTQGAKLRDVWSRRLGGRKKKHSKGTFITSSGTLVTNFGLKLLNDHFGVTPEDILEFEPAQIVDMPGHKVMVQGTVTMRHWGGAPYEAEVIGIGDMAAKNNTHQTWAVSPIGLGKPVLCSKSAPGSIRCEIINFNYKFLKDHIATDEEEENEVALIDAFGEVMPENVVEEYLKEGCVSCEQPINDDEIEEAILVNDDRSVMCVTCKNTMQELLDEAADGARRVH